MSDSFTDTTNSESVKTKESASMCRWRTIAHMAEECGSSWKFCQWLRDLGISYADKMKPRKKIPNAVERALYFEQTIISNILLDYADILGIILEKEEKARRLSNEQ